MVSRLFIGTAFSLSLLAGCSSGGGASEVGGPAGGTSGVVGGGTGGSTISGGSGSSTGGSSTGGTSGVVGGGTGGSSGSTSNSSAGQAGSDAGDDGGGATGGVPGGGATAGTAGENEAGVGDAPSVSTGSFSLTSTTLPPNGVYPVDNTCAGADLSPPLAWSGAPAGTMSFAIALRDNNHMTTRWVIWDIPPTTTSLPAALPGTPDLTTPPGAKQVDWPTKGNGYQYAGPCPGGQVHVYEFTLYALNVPMLPSVTTNSDRDVVRMAAIAHSIGTATLPGTSDATAKK